MRSNRKWEVEVLETVAVKAAHFVVYEWGAQHAEDMRRFLEGNRFKLRDLGEMFELEMPFEHIVLMLVKEYEYLGMFIERGGKIGYQLPNGVEVFEA